MVFLNTIFKHQEVSPSVISWFLSSMDKSEHSLSKNEVYAMCLDEHGLRLQATMPALIQLSRHFKRNPLAISEYQSIVGHIIEHREFTHEISNALIYDFFNLRPSHQTLTDAINETINELGGKSHFYNHLISLIESDGMESKTLECVFHCFHKKNIALRDINTGHPEWLNIYNALAKCKTSTLQMLKIGYAYCTDKIAFLTDLIKSHPDASIWKPFVCDDFSEEMNFEHLDNDLLSTILLHGNLAKTEQVAIFNFLTKTNKIRYNDFSYLAFKSKHNQDFSFLNDREFLFFTKGMNVYYPDSSNALIESARFPKKHIIAIHNIGKGLPPEKRLFIRDYTPKYQNEFIHISSLNEAMANRQATYISAHKQALAECGSDIYSHTEDLTTILHNAELSAQCIEFIADELKHVFIKNKDLKQQLSKQVNNTPRTLELWFSKSADISCRCSLVSNPSFPYEYLTSLLREDSLAHKLMMPQIYPHSAMIFDHVQNLSVPQYKELLELSNIGVGEFFDNARKSICAHILNIHSYQRSLSGEVYDKELTLEALHHAAKLKSITKEDWTPLAGTISIEDLDSSISGEKLSASLPVEFMEQALATHLMVRTDKIPQASCITDTPAKRYL